VTTSSTMDRAHAGDVAPPTIEPVTLHRRRGALALVGAGAGVTSLAYLWRGIADPGPASFAVALALLPVAAVHLAAWWDARVPLLVADDTGIRLRAGTAWTGLRWDEVSGVNVTPSRLPLRDARLEVANPAGADRPLPLPLAMVDPADVRALSEQIRELAPAAVDVVVAEPEPESEPEPEAEAAAAAEAEPEAGAADPPQPEPAPAAAASQPIPARSVRVARADVVVDTAPESVRVVPPSAPEARPLELSEPEPAPGRDPVIGPRLVEARRRLRLSVDDLAERTRIRPHVIEAIETDDFSSSGGDVYARGHLRVLARVLGIDAEHLVGEYDARYSVGPVTARKVFEAELAGPVHSVRTTGRGPRWSVLVAVVLVLVLVWGLARLLVPGVEQPADGPGRSGQPDSTGAGSPESGADTAARFAGMGERVRPTRLRLVGLPGSDGATPVVVRTDDGAVVFRGELAPGEVERLSVPGTATVVAPDAGAVAAAVNGRQAAPLGEVGEPARRTFHPA